MQSGYDSLVALPGVGISMADALYELGFYSAEEVSNATPEDLIQVRGIGEETAKKLIAAAQTAVLEAQQAEDIEEEKAKEADKGETGGNEGEQEQTDREKDTAPPDGASQNGQTDSADGDEPEKAETDIAEAAEQYEDKPENAESDKKN